MSTTKDLLGELDRKVSNLLSQLGEVRSEMAVKNQEIESLKTKLLEKSTAFETLLAENDALKAKLAAAPTLKEEGKGKQEEIKFKISEMVKEIDRCISLLKV